MAKRTYKSDVGAIPKIVDNFKPKTLNQRVFHDIISDDDTQLVLCHGIAGTGKTYVSIYKALQDVLRRGTPYEKLIIINPTVDVGNEDKLGFLPGELQAKFQKTIIFVSHDLNEALRIGDRIAIMKDGKIMQIGTGEEILTNPANDYVKTFVEDVDRAKVITAENIMIPALTTNIDVDGPSVALKKMKTEEVSSLMAVDKKRQFRGVVTSEQAIAARKNNQPLKDVMTTDVGKVSKEMLVRDILPIIYDAPTPLAVVDDNGFLKGVLIRGSVLEALADIPDEDEVEEIEKEEENK